MELQPQIGSAGPVDFEYVNFDRDLGGGRAYEAIDDLAVGGEVRPCDFFGRFEHLRGFGFVFDAAADDDVPFAVRLDLEILNRF